MTGLGALVFTTKPLRPAAAVAQQGCGTMCAFADRAWRKAHPGPRGLGRLQTHNRNTYVSNYHCGPTSIGTQDHPLAHRIEVLVHYLTRAPAPAVVPLFPRFLIGWEPAGGGGIPGKPARGSFAAGAATSSAAARADGVEASAKRRRRSGPGQEAPPAKPAMP